MLFNSYVFLLFFLPVTYAGYRILINAEQQEAKIIWLNGCSFFFYGWWNPAYLPLMLTSICLNFLIGKKLHQQANQASGKPILIVGILLNLLCLAYFKYTGFLLNNINQFLGTSYYISNIILPLAISFFTFQQIAYLVDTWKGQGDNYRLRYYCLFVVFFPHLLAGPIVHHKEIIPQFKRQHKPEKEQQYLAMAITAISFGLFKKVIFADTVAYYANQVFEHAETNSPISFFDAWIGTASFTLQIYFDFSAYSDIACGIALLFGVHLPQNFASPYRATSIIAFWQYWHMTLSRFLRNYVYIPLGGNRKGSIQRYRNLLITMLLGGLWHGAGWPFIIWGAVHGALLTINHAWCKITASTPRKKYRLPAILGGLLTYFCVMMTWILFRADNTETAFKIYQALFDINQIKWEHNIHQPVISDLCRQLNWQIPTLIKIAPIIIMLQAWVWCMPNLPQLMKKFTLTTTALPESNITFQWQPNWRWSILTACALSVSLMALHDTGDFIYFQF